MARQTHRAGGLSADDDGSPRRMLVVPVRVDDPVKPYRVKQSQGCHRAGVRLMSFRLVDLIFDVPGLTVTEHVILNATQR